MLGEFGFLMSVYHLDDRVERQQYAQARVSGALATWQPGGDTAAVEEAVRALATTGAPGADAASRPSPAPGRQRPTPPASVGCGRARRRGWPPASPPSTAWPTGARR